MSGDPNVYPVPTIGRIVFYRLTASDANEINRRRKHAADSIDYHRYKKTGAQVHIGNTVAESDVFPMMIVRVWGATPDSAVNGQVFLDGNDTFWVTSTTRGDHAGKFSWPTRV